MKIDIITIFPDMFSGPFSHSMLKRASEKQLVNIQIHDLRAYTSDQHKTIDARPYGGGPGMVMMVEPVYKAVKALKSEDSMVVAMTAKGTQYTQSIANQIAHKYSHLILIAGHYEGLDQRIIEKIANLAVSVGPYVLTGGEIPTMCVVDSVVRLLPGVLGDSQSILEESHQQEGVLEYPQYTRPADFNGWKVPDVLLSGNHKHIANWRKEQSMQIPEVALFPGPDEKSEEQS